METRNSKSSDVVKKDFWTHYNKSTDNPVDIKVYYKVFSEIFEAFSESITRDAGTIRLPRLGDFRVRAIKPKLFDAEGNFRKDKLKPDWKKSWEHWRKQYPGKTDAEIKTIPNKGLFYHMNTHSGGYSYETYWDKEKCNVKGQTYYKFKTTRKYTRLRAELVLKHGMVYYE
jgi:hypothetical protein